jgi:hypothetical protein
MAIESRNLSAESCNAQIEMQNQRNSANIAPHQKQDSGVKRMIKAI